VDGPWSRTGEGHAACDPVEADVWGTSFSDFWGTPSPPKPVDNSLSNVIRPMRLGHAMAEVVLILATRDADPYSRQVRGCRPPTSRHISRIEWGTISRGDNTDRVFFATHRLVQNWQGYPPCLTVRARVDGPGPAVFFSRFERVPARDVEGVRRPASRQSR
jgi:hypothetical protein